MRFPIDWSSETARRAAFTYMTRTGCAPRFGSRPIGWYQAHVCHALDVLYEITGDGEIRLRRGVFEEQHMCYDMCCSGRGLWTQLIAKDGATPVTPAYVYAEADRRSHR